MKYPAILCALCVLAGHAPAQAPATTAFTYQGSLTQGGAPAAGTFDLQFRLFDAPGAGAQVGPTLCAENVATTDGRFTSSLDFGAVFAGQQRYLEVSVRTDTGSPCSSTVDYTTLAPRQPITTAPHSGYALTAGTATNTTQLNGQPASFYQNAGNLNAGFLPPARLAGSYTGAVSFTNAANTFVGGGAGLTALNASSLSAGTLPDVRLSSNVALLAGTQTFSGTKSFNAAPLFNSAGSPFTVAASGLVANLNADLLDGLSSSAFAGATHTHDAAALTSGILADARLPSNIPRLNASANFLSGGSFGSALGIGTSSPSSLLEIRTADPQFRIRNTNDTGGGVIVNTFGSMQLGMFNPSVGAWDTVPALGYRAVLAVDSLGRVGSVTNTSAGPAYRNLLDDGSGRLGIGTSSPGAPLDVRVTGTQGVQIRLDAGLVPGLNVVGGGSLAGVMRLRNNLEVWPSDDATRAGRLDVRNTSGAPAITLDGASGNASYNNQPGIAYVQTFRDPRNFAAGVTVSNASQDVDNISVNAPSTGYLLITATLTVSLNDVNLDTSANEAFFKLDDMSSGSAVQLTEVKTRIYRDVNPSIIGGGGVLTISWVVPVNSPGTKSFKTGIFVPNGSATYFTTTLGAVFIPRGL